MKEQLGDLIKAFEALKNTIDKANFQENGFDQHGWNQVHLHRNNVSNVLYNIISRLKSYGVNKLSDDFVSSIDSHIDNINRLNTTCGTYFTNAANHLIHMAPNLLITLLIIINDIDYELFSWENIQNKKLVPKNVSNRLRSINKQLDSLGEASETLKGKIDVINDAHEAAESLPTDLASLQDAKKQVETLLSNAQKEVSTSQKEINTIQTDIHTLLNEARKSSKAAESFEKKAQNSSYSASKLVSECDDALQITTTQGLAAGFDQKAKELRNSIWVWILALLIALCAGAWIGAERVTAFTEVLGTPLTAGQAILHTIMSVFSIGGPLWLAWISTQQINQRFKLSEDYSYKATVAKAFTGFRKLAERFDPATEERLFNSTLDRLDEMPLRLIKGKDYNSPWHEFTDSESFKKAIDAIPALAKEASRFASKTKLKYKAKHSENVQNHSTQENIDDSMIDS